MASKTPPVLGLHHAAYRCRDAEETRHFYEDILGLPLVHVVTADHVSTGSTSSFAHVFFELADGSCIDFFDPNGVRLEFTTPTVDDAALAGYAREAHTALKAWNEKKAQQVRMAARA